MDQELREQEWEKIRWQLGQIIKSWSKVERIITEDYVAYAVNTDQKQIFCFLYDQILLLHHLDDEMYDEIQSKFEVEKENIPFQVELKEKSLKLSLEKYRFTQIIPHIEKVYRKIVIGQ